MDKKAFVKKMLAKKMGKPVDDGKGGPGKYKTMGKKKC